MCGQLADKASVPTDQRAEKPPRETFESEWCPSCRGPMERGYVLGARGVFWNDHIPKQICTGEQLSDKGLYWGWICPSVKALRCRKCRIIRY
ncbi:MAG: hypothetical protein C4K49_06065 [Candidatus Thorarchaeota archaeon]|nr:MAG: hypothetical protein C4K49_06065 [Candidatus Thorarchaeota archaeon]